MSWPASLFIALLNGLFGLFVSGLIGAMAVDWYHISSFEGGSGYFVVLLGLLGFVAGVIIGIIVARRVAAGARPGFLRGLGVSLAIVLGIGVVSGGLTRALADVPPELDGEGMLLAVEIRWPAGQKDPPIAVGENEAAVSLHSIPLFSHTVRASESGPLWMEDAHLVDGRWVVPGAVAIFTTRGTRMLSIDAGNNSTQGFQVPMSAFPGKRDTEWSDWLPKFREGVKIPPDLLSYRYRAVKVSQPIRTETFRPFEVLTIAGGFYQVQRESHTLNAATATFSLRYQGKPLIIEGKTNPTDGATQRFDEIDGLALLAAPRPAFLVHVSAAGGGYDYLVTEDGSRVRMDYVAESSSGSSGQLLTSNAVLFRAAAKWEPVPGRINRVSYPTSGLYRVGNTVVDTRLLTLHYFTPDSTVSYIPEVPPLGLSPDQRSFVTYSTSSDSTPRPVLLVTDFIADKTYTLPIDPARMRYAKFESLDPAWLEHHFEWKREKGVDRLFERKHFVPLPWQGELSVESDGNRTYRLEKGSEALRSALIDFLVTEFTAKPQPADSGAYQVPVVIGDKTVNVAFSSSYGESFGYVAVSIDRSTKDSTLVSTIAERFNAVLATGKYDGLFER